jgi:uncharacterized protein YbaP (TraB family)
MKRAALVLSLIAAATACKRTEEAAPAPKATPAAAANDQWAAKPTPKDPLPHPLFWSAEKDGKTTYFLGTMHIGIDAESRLPASVWQKLDGAHAFAMETDISDQSLAKRFMEPTQTSLHEQLGDDDWQKLQRILGAAMAAKFDHLKPAISAMTMELKLMPPTAPMDGVLQAHAANAKKPVVFLEPAIVQVEALEKWMDIKALKAMLAEADDLPKHMKELVDAYVAGDEQKMVALSDEERADALKHGYTEAEYTQETEDMLYHRNATWIPVLEKMHADGGGFVAVGALHLVGPRSVLDLLAKDGFAIKRVAP